MLPGRPIALQSVAMEKKWIKFTLEVAGIEPGEAAGILAGETGLAVEIVDQTGGPVRLAVWMEAGGVSADTARGLASAITGAFPVARAGVVSAETQDDADWLAKWKESLKPLPVGGRLVIVPSWLADTARPGRVAVILDPGMAFGSGHHATTYGCLEMIEKLPPARTLDVGCGSGLLAIAAARLGAPEAVGVDIDPEAVRVARENAALNSVEGAVSFTEGGVEAVEGRFGLVVANIFLNELVRLAPEIRGKVARGGALVISGLRENQADEAARAYEAQGLSQAERIVKDGWATILFR